MTEKVKVVVGPEALEDAYRRGYDRFSGMDDIEATDFTFSHFTENAIWANSIAPSLRASAGFSDSKGGTYRTENKVALVEYPEDRPMDGELIDSHYVYDALVDAYQMGAMDGATGDSMDVDSVMHLL